mgnify:CR=1 FL=1
MASLFILANIVILSYFGYKIETEYSKKREKGELTTKWMWDESIIRSMVSDMEMDSQADHNNL